MFSLSQWKLFKFSGLKVMIIPLAICYSGVNQAMRLTGEKSYF